MRWIAGLFLTAWMAGLVGCGSTDRSQAEVEGKQPPPTSVSSLPRWADDDALAWAMIADHVVVVRAEGERTLPPDDQLKLREFTFVVEDVLWSRAAAVALPASLSWPVWGWARHGDEGAWSEMNPHDGTRVEEGRRYLIPVVWSPAGAGFTEGWTPLSEKSTHALIGDTDNVDKETVISGSWTYGLDTVQQVAARVREVTPRAHRVLTNSKVPRTATDPDQRSLAWVRWWDAQAAKNTS